MVTPPSVPSADLASISGATGLARLRGFVIALGRLIDQQPDEPRVLREGGALLAALIAHDDWLPDAFAQPDAKHYQQHLLHADAQERFSVVSFVWGPGQTTPVHDHTVWGLIGMLRGAETSQAYAEIDGRWQPQGEPLWLRPGQVEAVSPRIGDVHRVANAFADRVSVSIHVYGANIGAVARHVFPPEGGRKPFVSGYANRVLPNLWDRSADVRAGLPSS